MSTSVQQAYRDFRTARKNRNPFRPKSLSAFDEARSTYQDAQSAWGEENSEYAVNLHQDKYQGGGRKGVRGDKLATDITRQHVRLYNNEFRGYEDELREFFGDSSAGADAAQSAVDRTQDLYGATQGQAKRQLGRYGVVMNDREQAAHERSRGLQKAATAVQGANEARANTREQRRVVGQQLTNAGVDLSQQAAQNLSQSASMYDERDQAYREAKNQYKKNKTSSMMSGAGLGLSSALAIGTGGFGTAALMAGGAGAGYLAAN